MIFLIDKIMLQAINLHLSRQSPRPTCHRHSPNNQPKAQLTRKYVNLHFKEDDLTFGHKKNKILSSPEEKEEMFYRTFHPRDKQKKQRSHYYYSRKTGRETAISERDTVVGTPFASLDAGEQEIPVPVLPSLDRERYKYLLNAVSGGAKVKRLPEFKAQSKSNTVHQVGQAMPNSPTFPSKEIGSPNVINLSVHFEEARKDAFEMQSQNSYQKMFKNKQLLLKGRYSSIRQSSLRNPCISLLMEDELKVRQATFENRRKKRKIIK